MSPGKPLRAVFYSHDSYGLGHLRRSLSVAEAFTRRDPRAGALVLTGSPAPDLFDLPPRCDVVKIPSITKDGDGAYMARSLPVGLGEVTGVRSAMIAAAVRSFRPDLFVVDHTPSGPGGELLAILRRMRHEAAWPRVILGARDVLDSPARARAQLAREGTVEVLRACYDEVLVYGDPRVLDVCREYDFPADVRRKISYTGFVCPPPDVEPAGGGAAGEPVLLATAGGGEDGYALLRGVIAAMRGPLREAALRAVVVTGPLMAPAEVARLQLAAQNDPRIELLRSTRDMSARIARASLVLGMGGYNTVYETLRQGRRLLVAPRRRPREEQLERARRLAALGLLAVLGDEDLEDPARLAHAIESSLARRPASGLRRLLFDGADRAAARLIRIVEETRGRVLRAEEGA